MTKIKSTSVQQEGCKKRKLTLNPNDKTISELPAIQTLATTLANQFKEESSLVNAISMVRYQWLILSLLTHF